MDVWIRIQGARTTVVDTPVNATMMSSANAEQAAVCAAARFAEYAWQTMRAGGSSFVVQGQPKTRFSTRGASPYDVFA